MIKKVQERLLRQEDLDLEKAIQICRPAEEVNEHSHEINNGPSSSKTSIQVDKIGHKYTHKSSKSMKSKQRSSKWVNSIVLVQKNNLFTSS